MNPLEFLDQIFTNEHIWYEEHDFDLKKSQELTFSSAQLTFPNLMDSQAIDQLKILLNEPMANIPSLDTWKHMETLENQFSPKSCKYTALITNPNFA